MKYEKIQGYNVVFNIYKRTSPEMQSLKRTYESLVAEHGSSFSIKDLKNLTRQGVNSKNSYDRESAVQIGKQATNEAKK